MANKNISFSNTGLQKLLEKIERLDVKFSEEIAEELAEATGVMGVARIRENINLSLNAYEQPFKELKKPVSKKRGGDSAKPLLDDGDLIRSINYQVFEGIVIFGSNMSYAPFHQNGTDHIPARSFLPYHTLPKAWQKDIIKLIEKAISDIV